MPDPRLLSRGTVAQALVWAVFAYARYGWEDIRWPGMTKPRGRRRRRHGSRS